MTLPSVIFVDGLPGYGKSTTAQRLWLQLEALGRPARWWYEHESGHPIFDDERVRSARAGDAAAASDLFTGALAGWDRVASAARNEPGTVIFESTLFQSTVGTQLLIGWPHERIEAHFQATMQSLAGIPMALVYLRPPSVASAIRSTCERRHPWFETFVLQHLGESPRGERQPVRSLEDVITFFEELRGLTDGLFERFPGPKISYVQAGADWKGQQAAVTGFLGLPEAPEAAVASLTDFAGTFRLEGAEDHWQFAVDRGGLRFDGEHRGRLFPRGEDRFALEGSCAEILFDRGSAGEVRGLTCLGSLPGLPMRWNKL